MPKVMDITGQRFGHLTAVAFHKRHRSPNGGTHILWRCRCDCGNETIVHGNNLRRKSTRSCGCLQRKRAHEANLRHGDAIGEKPTREYRSWRSMLDRCENPKCTAYKNYGGRGITICKRWYRYENFLADMGRCPPGLTLERINNERGYSPSNCKWATYSEQAMNRRSTGQRTRDSKTGRFTPSP